MSLQRFSPESNTSKIKVSNNVSFKTRNVPNRVFHEKQYGNATNNGDIDYNVVLPGQDSSYYESLANAMLDDLVIGVNDPVVNRQNTRVLQSAMDFLAEHGGGTLNLPAGELYFGQGGYAGTNGTNGERFAILCRSNVHIKGAGADATILKPVRSFSENESSSMDMFFFNHYSTGNPPFAKRPDGSNFQAGDTVNYTYTDVEGNYVTLSNEPIYLTNADFSDFTIDASNVLGNKGKYTTAGKGFMINLFKDCDWNNVVVKDTDATGFGMDCPINCTITNCVAIGCGKQAADTDGGASGFGIGTGYANGESIVISNCKSYNNTKYGIFFEHQSRFQSDTSRYPATTADGFLVVNCEAGGNLYDFGGIKAYDVTFKNVRSISSEAEVYSGVPNARTIMASPLAYTSSPSSNSSLNNYQLDRSINGGYTKQHLYFSDYSSNCHVENSRLFSNITDVNQFGSEIAWAINSGSMTLKNPNEFGSHDSLTRMDVMQILYRYNGLPNAVDVTGRGQIGQNTLGKINNVNGTGNNFSDLGNYANEGGGLEAVLWGVNNRIVMPSTSFNPESACTRSQMVTMLYRMAGSPKSSGATPFTDIENGSWYSDALTWAYNNGIIKGISPNEFAPNRDLTKEEMAIILSRYDNMLSSSSPIAMI